MYRKGKLIFGAIFVVSVMLFSGFAVFEQGMNPLGASTATISGIDNISNLPGDVTGMAPVATSPWSVLNNTGLHYSGKVSVLVTFSFRNQSRLVSLLSNISAPNSPQYHKYLTRGRFASEFSASSTAYSQAVDYFSQFPGLSIRSYSDRVSLEISGPANQIGKAFNTSICTNSNEPSTYFASSTPELPLYVASTVSQVTGLSNSKIPVSGNLFGAAPASAPKIQNRVDGGYPAPVNNGGVQDIYGSDLQVAYDEQSLLNITYPTNEVIATILWAGTNSSGNPVGAFDPSDIYAYYNATLPSYEPHSKIFGVPLNGAAKPGVSASYDATGANQENTLDLEMVGSTAPGASIYNVYGPNSTYENIDSAFAFILNPNSTYNVLNNVSVITNSWGGTETNNTVWYQYLQEAQVRGISVLASSGDSGDNTASSKYVGSTVEFPSAMAYNDFGVTAVGGDTLTLANNLHILSETAWYISSADSSDGGPAGSTGGISSVFKEPVWQLDSEANNLLNGQGRGVPDISAIANNTFVYITMNGVPYYGGSAFTFWGTSVASPVEAGIVAEMDAVLNHYNQSNLGYLNPLIYSLANKQVAPMQPTSFTGYIQTGIYNSTLPTLPFYNVMYGRNHVYNATYGYNLVTGWGSIDAYNMSMYILNVNRNLSSNGLRGVDNQLVINDLNVTSYIYDPSTSTYYVNTFYNASIQQNLFLANQFGAPIYWIQNVVYINGSQSAGWVVNYTGWVVYPFFGQYPSQTVYEYNFPLGKTIYMPHTFNVKTWISNLSEPMQQTVSFEINSHIVSLPVPGAAYIIDANNYSYAWQGHTYYNGPFPDNPYPGGLNPQFGLIGGPSGGLGIFAKPTSGSVSAYVEPLDMNSYIPAITHVYNISVDETAEEAEFLDFTSVNGNTWSVSVNNNSLLQGILDYSPAQYSETFTESGLPSGTTWYVNLTNGMDSGPITGSSYSFSLVNGTYSYTVATSDKIYSPSPSSGSFTVNGASVSESIAFSKVTYSVKFTETGLSSGTTWYVNLTNGMDSGPITGSSYSFSLVNGTYSYTVATSDKIYSPSPSSGSFTVNGASVSESIAFSKVTYSVKFTETGLSSGTTWYVNGSGISDHELSPTNISFNLANGTYSFIVTNLSNYYTTNVHFTVVINGKNVTETVDYYHWAYITGKVSPTSATVTINGKSVALSSSGSFNISVQNGTYHVVASSSGYASYYSNFSLNPGNTKNLTVNLKQVSKLSTLSSTELYAIIGAVVAIAVIGSAVALIRKRK